MKRHRLCLAALIAAATTCAPAFAQVPGSPNDPMSPVITVTNATGTISQLNYGTDGTVDGFLLGPNLLLDFPEKVSGGVASLGAAGNSVTYSGEAITNLSGFQTVRVTSFTNNTTKATYSSSTKPPAPAAYGPTSGTVKQLNYDTDGTVDSFVFAPSGSTTPILVVTGPVTNPTLKSALTVGATVSVTGTTVPTTPGTCTVAGSLTVVDASSLAINGTTFILPGAYGFGSIGNPGRGRR